MYVWARPISRTNFHISAMGTFVRACNRNFYNQPSGSTNTRLWYALAASVCWIKVQRTDERPRLDSLTAACSPDRDMAFALDPSRSLAGVKNGVTAQVPEIKVPRPWDVVLTPDETFHHWRQEFGWPSGHMQAWSRWSLPVIGKNAKELEFDGTDAIVLFKKITKSLCA